MAVTIFSKYLSNLKRSRFLLLLVIRCRYETHWDEEEPAERAEDLHGTKTREHVGTTSPGRMPPTALPASPCSSSVVSLCTQFKCITIAMPICCVAPLTCTATDQPFPSPLGQQTCLEYSPRDMLVSKEKYRTLSSV